MGRSKYCYKVKTVTRLKRCNRDNKNEEGREGYKVRTFTRLKECKELRIADPGTGKDFGAYTNHKKVASLKAFYRNGPRGHCGDFMRLP
jgi:hypothetical protein